VAVTNYPFLLSELRYTTEIKRGKLLVCDEVQDLEKHLVDFAQFTLERSALASYRVKRDVASTSFLIGDRMTRLPGSACSMDVRVSSMSSYCAPSLWLGLRNVQLGALAHSIDSLFSGR
jgi:hypothetical protein